MSATKTKTQPPVVQATSARQHATQAVSEYFNAMLADREFFPLSGIADNGSQPSLGDVFEEVSNILEAEYVREHGPITDDQDVVLWQIGLAAGYLVGVQVGLRLRGGAR